jgi:ribose/xylose/arabinose/galactoside ABC-type transport system permease subunit
MISPEKLPPVLYSVWGPQWGFVGYLLAWVLGALRLSPGAWEAIYTGFFWLHFVVVSALLFYLPFSRFFHVIMSPVIVAYNTMLDARAGGSHS